MSKGRWGPLSRDVARDVIPAPRGEGGQAAFQFELLPGLGAAGQQGLAGRRQRIRRRLEGRAAAGLGIRVDVTAREYTLPGLIAALEQHALEVAP